MLCLGSVEMDLVISESCYKQTILQSNYRKMIILWSFSYNSFVKLNGKKMRGHNITMLYPNLCYNEVCYKGTALYHTKKSITGFTQASLCDIQGL